MARHAVLSSCLLSTIVVRASIIPVEYRWVYRNPLTISQEETPGEQNKNSIPLQYSHMGMLATLPNGSLAAAWQASADWWEGGARQWIWWAVSGDSGLSWGPPQMLVPPQGDLPAWGPVLHVQDNSTWLFYSHSRSECWWTGEGGRHWSPGGDILMKHSLDSGGRWSNSRGIMSFEEGGIPKVTGNKLVVTQAGDWLLPFWREAGGHCPAPASLHGTPALLVSPDQGKTWKTVDIKKKAGTPDTWLIEGTLAGVRVGKQRVLVQHFRTQVGLIYQSKAQESLGASSSVAWSPAAPTNLPNPNSKVALVSLADDVLLLAFNDARSARSPLTLATSADGGATWQRLVILEAAPAGSFHYPTAHLVDADTLAIVYSVDVPPPGGACAHRLSKAPSVHSVSNASDTLGCSKTFCAESAPYSTDCRPLPPSASNSGSVRTAAAPGRAQPRKGSKSSSNTTGGGGSRPKSMLVGKGSNGTATSNPRPVSVGRNGAKPFGGPLGSMSLAPDQPPTFPLRGPSSSYGLPAPSFHEVDSGVYIESMSARNLGAEIDNHPLSDSARTTSDQTRFAPVHGQAFRGAPSQGIAPKKAPGFAHQEGSVGSRSQIPSGRKTQTNASQEHERHPGGPAFGRSELVRGKTGGLAVAKPTRGNAWGRVSLGMRVALLSAPELIKAARAAAPALAPSPAAGSKIRDRQP
eukprot:jgi/Botrbrau1/2805/Bobra.0125s0016.1